MKSVRILLALALCGAVSNSHAVVSRFAKPFASRLVSSVRSRPKLILGAGLLGTGAFSSYAYQQKLIRNDSFSTTGTITIKDLSGNIDVEGWDKDRLHIEALKEANDLSAFNDTEIVINSTPTTVDVTTVHRTQYTADTPPTIKITGSEVYFNDRLAPSVRYAVKVPYNSHLKIKTIVGSVKLKDIHGSVNVQTVSGNIDTDLCFGVAAKSTSGNINLRNSEREVTAETVAGNVSIAGKKDWLKSATAKTVSGNVFIYGAETAHAKSVVGNVRVSGVFSGSASSAAGNAEFTKR